MLNRARASGVVIEKKMEQADLVRQRFSWDKWWVLWGELSLLIWLLPEGPIFPPYSAVSRPGQNWKMYKTQVRRINLHTTALHSSLVQHFINIFSFSSQKHHGGKVYMRNESIWCGNMFPKYVECKTPGYIQTFQPNDGFALFQWALA